MCPQSLRRAPDVASGDQGSGLPRLVAGRTCLLADRWFCAGLSESRLTFRQTEGKAAPSVEKYGSEQRLWTVFTETRAAAAAARSVGFTVHRPSRHLVHTRLALALARACSQAPIFSSASCHAPRPACSARGPFSVENVPAPSAGAALSSGNRFSSAGVSLWPLCS